MIRRIKYLQLLFCLSVLPTFGFSQIPEKPNPQRQVNDFGDYLNDQEEQELTSILSDYYKSSSYPITVVTVKELGDYDISSFAFELGEKWGIGKKKVNNGILLLACRNPRKIYIATGYGVEELLTDAKCKRIISNTIGPNFKKEQFFEGFKQGVEDMKIVLGGGEPKEKSGKKSGKSIGFPFIIVLVIIIIFISKIKRFQRRIGGGWGTLGSGGFYGGHWGGGGGGWGGGSSSGGGGFDGFDGFGGGSFGGGGAGGDY